MSNANLQDNKSTELHLFKILSVNFEFFSIIMVICKNIPGATKNVQTQIRLKTSIKT